MALVTSPWRTTPGHRSWLSSQADNLFDFYQFKSINPQGGFNDLSIAGDPLPGPRQLHATTRMVHCFVIGHLLGRPGCDALVDHGMTAIWNQHRDRQHGGYVWSFDDDGPADTLKQAYGHAFVLLAASGAKIIGHPLADKVLADVTEVINTRFWEKRHGAMAEEFAADWSPISAYRGQNSNMHSTEALMAAFEATGDHDYLHKAESIASLIIGKCAAGLGYRVGEHFDVNWTLDKAYSGGDIFRPAGATPGHWLEWSRLLIQLWELGSRKHAWLPEAADRLFRNSVALGWDQQRGGFHYTLDWDNRPLLRQKLWWPSSEGIGAAHALADHHADPFYEEWYRRIWGFCNLNFIDHENGGWFHEIGDDLKPASTLFSAKYDIYHALQACLIPLYKATGSLTRMIGEG